MTSILKFLFLFVANLFVSGPSSTVCAINILKKHAVETTGSKKQAPANATEEGEAEGEEEALDESEESGEDPTEEESAEEAGEEDAAEEQEETAEEPVEEDAVSFTGMEKGGECAVRKNIRVDDKDGTLSDQKKGIKTWEACRDSCNRSYKCEAYTWFGRVRLTAAQYTCQHWKKTQEDGQWHKPVQFVAYAAGIKEPKDVVVSGYPPRHCELCGRREFAKKYRGKNLQIINGVNTWEQCQDKCEENSACKTFSFVHAYWHKNYKKCILKNKLKHRGQRDSKFSSGIPCK